MGLISSQFRSILRIHSPSFIIFRGGGEGWEFFNFFYYFWVFRKLIEQWSFFFKELPFNLLSFTFLSANLPSLFCTISHFSIYPFPSQCSFFSSKSFPILPNVLCRYFTYSLNTSFPTYPAIPSPSLPSHSLFSALTLFLYFFLLIFLSFFHFFFSFSFLIFIQFSCGGGIKEWAIFNYILEYTEIYNTLLGYIGIQNGNILK